MNWLAREAGRAAVRKIVYLVIAVLIGVVSTWWNTASAQTAFDANACTSVESGCSDVQAKNYCVAAAAKEQQMAAQNGIGFNPNSSCQKVNTDTTHPERGYYSYGPNHQFSFVRNQWYFGKLDQCNGMPPDPFRPGQCMTPEKCSKRNSDPNDPGYVGDPGKRQKVKTSTTDCVGSCEMGFSGGSEKGKTRLWSPNGLYNDVTTFSGSWEYTGNVCGVAPSAPTETPEKQKEKPKEVCRQLGNQTACMMPDGRVCPSGHEGRELCWTPGETGQKTDGSILQTKKPGTTEGAPTIALPNGDTASKQGSVSVEHSSTVNNTTTISNTTITTYITNSGADAGTKNEGKPTEENGQGEDDSKDKDKGEASGGGNCKVAPSCSGDSIQCAQVQQAWLARCSADTNDNGQPDWTEVEDMNKDASNVFNDSQGNGKFWADGTGSGPNDGSQLDQGGFVGGSGSCPALSAMGGTGGMSSEFAQALVNPPPEWCNYIRAIYAIVLVLATIAGVYIVAGKKGD
ncbi:hypothetical protein G7069_08745 [Lysobacter sp. HDW10]|uniref:hypothetical protein n=1 Tax=Lysobacter sp. HDW10 TaxID=2714936 RepID=UPI00140913A2|nr:hypothetical protein [Lysobacter sp. HDW10]QIK81673.1 hypothetical protein G7069_08745 [Lysobacter sp. HDW10]